MPREGVRSRWSKLPVHQEEEGGTGRGNLWYNKVGVGVGDGAFEITSASHRTEKGSEFQAQ